jgi:large subunit ribosomal protein L28
MSRKCGITGKKPMVGNNVSHSNRKTRRRYLPNMQSMAVLSDTLGRSIRLTLSTSAIRTIEHNGGIDTFLLKTPDRKLGEVELKLKKQITKAAAKKAAKVAA